MLDVMLDTFDLSLIFSLDPIYASVNLLVVVCADCIGMELKSSGLQYEPVPGNAGCKIRKMAAVC